MTPSWNVHVVDPQANFARVDRYPVLAFQGGTDAAQTGLWIAADDGLIVFLWAIQVRVCMGDCCMVEGCVALPPAIIIHELTPGNTVRCGAPYRTGEGCITDRAEVTCPACVAAAPATSRA